MATTDTDSPPESADVTVPLPDHANATAVLDDDKADGYEQEQDQEQDQKQDDTSICPGTVYEAYIVTNPEICNGCFSRFRVLEPAPDDEYWDREHGVRTTNGLSSQTLQEICGAETLLATADGLVANAPPVVDWRNSPEKRGRPAWICADCGVIDGGVEMAARSADELKAAAKRIFKRVREQGVECDREALLGVVMEMKTTPATAAKDFDILAAGVAAGVRSALLGPTAETAPREMNGECECECE
jgi:hypothetical protein